MKRSGLRNRNFIEVVLYRWLYILGYTFFFTAFVVIVSQYKQNIFFWGISYLLMMSVLEYFSHMHDRHMRKSELKVKLGYKERWLHTLMKRVFKKNETNR